MARVYGVLRTVTVDEVQLGEVVKVVGVRQMLRLEPYPHRRPLRRQKRAYYMYCKKVPASRTAPAGPPATLPDHLGKFLEAADSLRNVSASF